MASPTDFIKLVWNGIIAGFIVVPGAQAAVDDTRRAYGINPDTGYVPAVYANAATGIGDAEQRAATQYVSGFDSAFAANGGYSVLPFSPTVGGDAKAINSFFDSLWPFGGGDGAPSSAASGSSALVILLVVLVGLFIFVKVVK